MTDEDILLNEARRICTSLDGTVNLDALRRQFSSALTRSDPRRRGTHAAFHSALERAKLNHQLRQDDNGNLRLRDL